MGVIPQAGEGIMRGEIDGSLSPRAEVATGREPSSIRVDYT